MSKAKEYKFSELSSSAKKVAVKEYISGWEETHEAGDMSEQDAYSSCVDTEDDVVYTSKGELINEEE